MPDILCGTPTSEEWDSAKQGFLTYLRGLEDQDAQDILYAGRMLSVRGLTREVEQETKIGQAHILMYFRNELREQEEAKQRMEQKAKESWGEWVKKAEARWNPPR